MTRELWKLYPIICEKRPPFSKHPLNFSPQRHYIFHQNVVFKIYKMFVQI